MDFEYCEKCGKRVSKDDIKSGSGTYDGVHYFCPDCSPEGSAVKTARSSRTNGSNGRPSSASISTPPPVRSTSRRPSRADAEFDDARPRSRDRESRASSRSSDRNDRSNGHSRDSYRGREPEHQGMNKNLLIGGGLGVAIILIGIIFWAVSGTAKKPMATPTPIASIAPSPPAYADAVAQADKIFSEAKKMYDKGKNSSTPSEGIKKAIDHLEKGLFLLYEVLDEYDRLKIPHPKPVEDLVTMMQSLNEGWKKSMPIDVW